MLLFFLVLLISSISSHWAPLHQYSCIYIWYANSNTKAISKRSYRLDRLVRAFIYKLRMKSIREAEDIIQYSILWALIIITRIDCFSIGKMEGTLIPSKMNKLDEFLSKISYLICLGVCGCINNIHIKLNI